ncbi:unnamed protein product [Nyctereutes procyonoides]|uniref:(raccoon dog) hypothetical protein n=1 Tax=Nyctereutes procyonoides TaxID=34880 RepID=A0A811YD15_NYCPR|nr:unnamed protein product [Nyctereutes procyonoides]
MWLSDSLHYGVFVCLRLCQIRAPPSSSPRQVESAGGERPTNPRLRNLPRSWSGPEMTPQRGLLPLPPRGPRQAGFLRPQLQCGGTSSPAVRPEARPRGGRLRGGSARPDFGAAARRRRDVGDVSGNVCLRRAQSPPRRRWLPRRRAEAAAAVASGLLREETGWMRGREDASGPGARGTAWPCGRWSVPGGAYAGLGEGGGGTTDGGVRCQSPLLRITAASGAHSREGTRVGALCGAPAILGGSWNADKIPVTRLLCICGDESCRTKTVKQEDRRCLGAS